MGIAFRALDFLEQHIRLDLLLLRLTYHATTILLPFTVPTSELHYFWMLSPLLYQSIPLTQLHTKCMTM